MVRTRSVCLYTVADNSHKCGIQIVICLLPFTVKPKDIPPEFVEIFKDTSITEKENLILKAKVTGKPPPEVKWFRSV